MIILKFMGIPILDSNHIIIVYISTLVHLSILIMMIQFIIRVVDIQILSEVNNIKMFYLIQVIIIAFLIRSVVQYMTHDPSAEHARVLQAATRRRLSVRWVPDVPSVAPINSANAVVAVSVVLGLGGVDVPATPILSTHGRKAFGLVQVS